ncbi:PQQ-binding-like beta-propeller repeat protein [Micromonospora sp. SH-82]|uniref:outer membrane protein assembly factor BamB family protein n=1 Tax=Micromonospora sp. SH-82 TaxID=3132938 RepID=UPI003EBB6A61
MGFPKGRRLVAAVVAALTCVGLVGVVVYRVLAPAEVVTPATAALPPVADPEPKVVARLPVAPLIVDGRFRVYAATRQVYADSPVDGRSRNTPYWSYRRWPAQVSGVVANGTTVLSRWSDGKLVALDALTGEVAWQADGPEPTEGWTSRRTGADAVWDPPGLLTARDAAGSTVVVVSGAERLNAFALADGRELWTVAVDSSCRSDVGTTSAGQFVAVDRCAEPVVEFRDLATGEPADRWRPPGATAELGATLVGCAAVRTNCRGLRTTGADGDATRGWLVGGKAPRPAPALDPVGAELDGERVVTVTDNGAVARSVRTGEELWRRGDLPTGTRILAVQPGRVHLLTPMRGLITLDPSTGAEHSRFALAAGRDGVGWAPGRAYAQDGYLAVERLKEPVAPDADDSRYFLTPEAVVLAAT